MDDRIAFDPLAFANPRFHEELYEDVADMLLTQLETGLGHYDDDLEDEVHTAIAAAARTVFSVVAPRRSYKRTFIRKPANIPLLTSKIEWLRSVPQAPQRSTEWYDDRWNRLTAASMHKCFGTPSSRNQIRYEKCKPIDTSKYDHVCTESAMHHGTKYEPVSIMMYEKDYNTKVEEFGCIPHSTYGFIGASPDGINTDPSSSRYGRMLEIKNIVNRPITGIPKIEYWIQMQIQMETCELNECDFLETRIIEYESRESFLDDGPSFCKTKEGKRKGVVMQFMLDGKPNYQYAPLDIDSLTFDEWEAQTMEENKHATWVKNLYWRLDQTSCVLVLRNRLWFEHALPVIAETWQDILRGRRDGYEQYAPRMGKRVKPTPAAEVVIVPSKIDSEVKNDPMIIDTSKTVVEKSQYILALLEEVKHSV